MWQGFRTIMGYKGKASHVGDTDGSLLVKLNTFFDRFEENTEPQSMGIATQEDCELLFSVADVSKTFQHVNPRKAAGPDGIPSYVLRACADQLAGVFTGTTDPSLSSPLA
jgi:hypothetical protein